MNSWLWASVLECPGQAKVAFWQDQNATLNNLLIQSPISRAYSSTGLPGNDLLLCSCTGGSCQRGRAQTF